MEHLYANVPRDLTRVKTKLFLNLTKRQILCFLVAVLIGVPLFFLIKKTGNNTLAATVMILVMLPLFFLAMYEKNGMPLEVLLRNYADARIKRPRKRIYRSVNAFRKNNATIQSSTGQRNVRNTKKEAAHVQKSKKRNPA